jgi:hypothetical protein
MNEKEVRQSISDLSKLSTSELMTQLGGYVAAQKLKDGGVSMMKTIERIKPFLNAEQRKKLDEVIKSFN